MSMPAAVQSSRSWSQEEDFKFQKALRKANDIEAKINTVFSHVVSLPMFKAKYLIVAPRLAESFNPIGILPREVEKLPLSDLLTKVRDEYGRLFSVFEDMAWHAAAQLPDEQANFTPDATESLGTAIDLRDEWAQIKDDKGRYDFALRALNHPAELKLLRLAARLSVLRIASEKNLELSAYFKNLALALCETVLQFDPDNKLLATSFSLDGNKVAPPLLLTE